MPENIDTRVSPALDPEAYRAVDGYNDDTSPFVDVVVNAFNEIYQKVGQAHDARALAESNPAMTPEDRVIMVGREIEGAKQRALTRLARAERDLRANIEHTERALSEPLTERAGLGSLNTEVRSFVRALEPAERTKFMAGALERGDGPTLEAVLGAQCFLSGMSQVEHDHYLRTYHEKKSPQLVRRLDVMNCFLGMVERNGPVVSLQFDKAIGAKPAAVAKLGALKDQSEAALAALKAERA